MLIVVRAICPKDMVQLKGCNRLITYRWNSITNVGCAKLLQPVSARGKLNVEAKHMDTVMSVMNVTSIKADTPN